MSDSGPQTWPTPASYNAWAVIDVADETIVRINDHASELLGLINEDLPIALALTLTGTDAAVMTERVLPTLRSGRMWTGRLRYKKQPDVSPVPSVLVPHVSLDGATSEVASLLFSSPETGDATTMVLDPLTGLATRSTLFSWLESAVLRNRGSATLLASLFVDLDGLKNINDRYGHEVGDIALVETAQRIAAQIPDHALAVRFGGDEFVIVFEGAQDLDAVELVAENILEALQRVGDYQAVSASIGVAVSRSGELDAQELIRRSDTAMYRAKSRGGSQVAIFDADMRTKQRSDEALRASLLEAIANNGFIVVAQPIFELATGRILGVELLTRVRDDAPYIAKAGDLFRLAHEYGEAFDAAVLGRALALARVWKRSFGTDAPRVHVNVSAQSLAASQFARRVREALAADGLNGSAIGFEIDGRDLATAGERERETIEGLRALEIPLVVDGFGVSSLSLADLASWQPTMVKVAGGEFPHRVLAGMIRAISSLSVRTCVKSLETQHELQAAVSLGTYAGQGIALTPVTSIDRINAHLQGPQRLGF